MHIEDARAQDILGFHRIHSCGHSPCTCYDGLCENTAEVIKNWDNYKHLWIVVATRHERRYCGACETAEKAEDWRQELSNLDDDFSVLAPAGAAGAAPPGTSGDFKIVDGNRNEFCFTGGHLAIFRPYAEDARQNQAGTPGHVEVTEIDHPVRLLQELANFLGYEALPRALTIVDKPVDRAKWYIVDRESNHRLKECDSEFDAMFLAVSAKAPEGSLAVIPGEKMLAARNEHESEPMPF